MALQVSGNPIKASEIKTELGQTGSLSLNSASARNLAGKASGTIKYSDFYGKSSLVGGNSGIITTAGAGTYTLPATSGTTIKALIIGAGGGGGGGTGRIVNTGRYSGGGGGAAGEARYIEFSATPGSTISFTVGAAGSAGLPRDGGYSLGTEATIGGYSNLFLNGSSVCYAAGGTHGGISQYQGYGIAGTNGGGFGGTLVNGPALSGFTVYYMPIDFSDYDNFGGGWGREGTLIDATVGATTVYSIGTRGVGGWGNASGLMIGRGMHGISWRYAVTGTGYGGGGSGGGKDDEYFGYTPGNTGSAGNTGAVFFWWGY